jgi:hypothetical protein
VNERDSERTLALAGVVGVVVILISSFLPGSPPNPDDSAAKIGKFLVDNNDQIRWAGFVGVLGSIVILGWVGAVWRLMRRADGGTPLLAVGAAIGAAMAAALLNASGVLLSVMAIIGPHAMGPSNTRLFYLLSTSLGAAGAMGLALFIGSFSTVIIETGVLPRLMGWLGALVAVVLLSSGGMIASTRDVFFVLTFIGFIGFALWTAIVSILMFLRAGARASAPVAVQSAA